MKRSPGSFVVCVVLSMVAGMTARGETIATERIPAAPGLESSRSSIPYQNELDRSAKLPDLTQDPHVIEMLTQLWKLTHNGSLCYERGAWIIRAEDGEHSCHQVPPTYQCNQLTFQPVPPPGAIAFVHTHPAPRGVSRQDQGADKKVAEIIGLPLYTIEIDGISKYDPATGKTTKEIDGRAWRYRADKDGCHCPVPGDPNLRMAKKKRAAPAKSAGVIAGGN